MTLTELTAKLEQATGPSRELDLHIVDALGFPTRGRGEELDYWPNIEEPGVPIPLLTSSLDAAVALCKKVLPSWHWSLNSTGPDASVWPPNQKYPLQKAFYSRGGKTPALALCLAVVRALIEKERAA